MSKNSIAAENFTHLHVHSAYSFSDGVIGMEALLQRAADLDMSALALTDHDSLAGAIPFIRLAGRMGIRPILGCELTLEGGYHPVLLVKELIGYQNLCQLLTNAYKHGAPGKPQATREDLAKHSQGLIAIGGFDCGEVSRLVRNYHSDDASSSARFYKEIFGEDFYLEVCRRPALESDIPLQRLVAFAREINIPLVATNAVHYLETRLKSPAVTGWRGG